MTFRLRFPESEITYWADRYDFGGDIDVENEVAAPARKQGYLTRNQFLKICEWKTKRSRKKCEKNDEGMVREATRIALSANHEPIKIAVLRSLDGIDWPTASTILHFCDARPYPILDFRALWSLGIKKYPAYVPNRFFREYTEYVRNLSASTGHSMRVIDRALWQYSKEKQKG